jgi:peptidyl-prolyl cis-trans isomerase NIMA-interacting 1
MSDSLEPNISPKTKPNPSLLGRTSSSKRTEHRSALPDWVPWAVLGGLLVAGAVGSRVVRAAVASSEVDKTSGPAPAPSNSALAPAAPKTAASAAPTASTQAGNAAEPRISVQYLVITHAESIMGRSLKITRTREQAKARATEVLGRARKGDDFAKLIAEYSDDAHKAEFHGEQLNFSRKDAIPTFSAAAFALNVGQISDVVDTPFGYMVIRRIK